MNKKEKNNKGFSLVELIIVIAIMAILVGVLAPQFLKYVERSKKSTDCQNVSAIVSAIEVYCADPNVTDKIANNATVTLTTTSKGVDESGVCTGNTEKALKAAGISNVVLKSSDWGVTSYVITVTMTDGVPTFAESTGLTGTNSILNGKY